MNDVLLETVSSFEGLLLTQTWHSAENIDNQYCSPKSVLLNTKRRG
jgi:hypothetical protein